MTKQTPLTPTSRRRKLALSAAVAIGSLGVVAGVGGGHASAIVDGADTTVSANPWQVAVTSPDGEQFCGGSIVSDRIIVTAAHCVQGTPEGEIAILAGATDLTSGNGQTRNVTAVIEHPKYASGVGDIAMLVLDRPLDMGGDVAAISLATSADISNADTARITGWGTTSETSEQTPSTLQSTDVPLVSDADCGLIEEGNADELCAGGTGTDSCYGDSGGPLTVATENGQVLAGVVSWGEECGGETAGVYAEVPTFADWVAERVDDPDAPAGERLPAEQFEDGDFEDGDFEDGDFEDGDFEDGEYMEIDDAFFDQYTDDELDAMSDDEFFEAYDEWAEGQDGGDASEGDNHEQDDAPSTVGDLPSNDDIDAMTDAEFENFIDGLSDNDFDQFLNQYDVEMIETDDGQFDSSQSADETIDFELNGDAEGSEWIDFSDDDFDVAEFDLNDDDLVQWSELVG